MNKETYHKMLLDPRWKKVRLRIVKRDHFKCRKCFKRDCRLYVHHIVYIANKPPWDTPDNYLISLCEKCHTKEHEGRLLQAFKGIFPIAPGRDSSGSTIKGKTWVAGKGLVDIPTKGF